MDGNAAYVEASKKLASGQLGEAERLCRAGLAQSPYHLPLTVLLGDILARLDRPNDAIAAYERADRLKPGMPMLFTRSVLLRFREAFGPPPPAEFKGDGPRIQMTRLGMLGRFGNQLLQYAFVRFYAQQHNLVLEVPDWIGRDLYDFNDPLPSVQLPTINEDAFDFFEALNGRAGPTLSEHDIAGYFCGSTARWGNRADAFRALFAPGPKIRPFLDRAWSKVSAAGRTVVAVHIRRKDVGYNGFWVAPIEWYLTWLRRIWPDLEDPVLYVASDTDSLVSLFAEFPCWDASKLGIDIPGAEFMVDHHILSQADYVAISHSSFSFTAAMLNARARCFVRPHPNQRELITFEPWSAEVLVPAFVGNDEVPARERLFLEQRFRITGSVIHLGEYCAPWTHLVRLLYPTLRVAELGSGAVIDRFRQNTALGHIGTLFAGDVDALPRVVEGARHTLSRSRIDTLHFRVGLDGSADPVQLAGYGYAIFRLTEAMPDRVDANGPLGEGSYVAVHERLVPGFLGVSAPRADVVELCRRYGILMRGVVHVGAHEGEQLLSYEAAGAQHILMIEANPAVYVRLAEAARGHHGVVTANRAIADKAGTFPLHLTTSDKSASLLPMLGYREVYPKIAPAGSIDVQCATLDGILEELGLDRARFNVLNIGVQGAEAMVLGGARNLLRDVEAIAIEVNFFELQKDCAQIEQIDEVLEGAGFRRVATMSAAGPSWADAFYVRR